MNDREWDKRLRVKTVGREDVFDANYAPYEPTPYPVLERLAESGLIKRRDHVLDYGCGKGRVAFFLADQIGCRVTGIEQSEKLIALAKENRRTARTGDRVELVHALAEQYAPRDENAFFFFNPFSAVIFESALRRIEGSALAGSASKRVFCYYPSEEYVAALERCPHARFLREITFDDVFGGRDARERLIAYEVSVSVD